MSNFVFTKKPDTTVIHVCVKMWW